MSRNKLGVERQAAVLQRLSEMPAGHRQAELARCDGRLQFDFKLAKDHGIKTSIFIAIRRPHTPEGHFRGIDVEADEMWLTTDTGELLRVTVAP